MNSSANLAKTPQQAWDEMLAGNQRFVTGTLAHPRQDIDHREVLAAAQLPFAALFGCSDSRLSAEIIFDVGLGDLFVVRNAGQVIAKSILGSLEYAVEVLQVPLIIVLGHDDCGAIKATIDSVDGNLTTQPNGDVEQLVEGSIHFASLGRLDLVKHRLIFTHGTQLLFQEDGRGIDFAGGKVSQTLQNLEVSLDPAVVQLGLNRLLTGQTASPCRVDDFIDGRLGLGASRHSREVEPTVADAQRVETVLLLTSQELVVAIYLGFGPTSGLEKGSGDFDV